MTELSQSTSSCSSLIFVKYNVEIVLLIDKIICMEGSQLYFCWKNDMVLKINQVGNCNGHVINIWSILWSPEISGLVKEMFLSDGSVSPVKCDPQMDFS